MFTKYMKDFLFYYEFTERKSQNTIKSLKKDIEQLYEYSVENNINLLEKINSTDLRGFVVKLQKDNVSKRSLNRKLSSIRVFFKYLQKKEIVKQNPVDLIIAPSFQVDIPDVLSMEEINKIRDIINVRKCNGIRDRLIVELLFSSGITPMEMIMMGENVVNLDKREAQVKNSKEIRTVFFSETTKKYFELYFEAKKIKYKEKYDRDIIFVNGSGTRLSDRSLRRILVKYGEMAGIKKEVSPFIFRHTFGTFMLLHGMDIILLKYLMGHTNIETTKVYQEIIKKPTIVKGLEIIKKVGGTYGTNESDNDNRS